MAKTKGRVTLPSEGNFLNETREIMERWGAECSPGQRRNKIAGRD